MTISYDVVFVKKPAQESDVLELLSKIEADEAQIERITADYARAGLTPERVPEYKRIADRIKLRFSLAEGYWQEIQEREIDDQSADWDE